MSKKVVLFSGQNCAPCKALKPLLEAEQQKRGFAYEVHVLEINFSVFKANDVRAVPTLVLYDGEHEVSRVMGGKSQAELVALLDKWGV